MSRSSSSATDAITVGIIVVVTLHWTNFIWKLLIHSSGLVKIVNSNKELAAAMATSVEIGEYAFSIILWTILIRTSASPPFTYTQYENPGRLHMSHIVL